MRASAEYTATLPNAVCFAQVRALGVAKNGRRIRPSLVHGDGKMTTHSNNDQADEHGSESNDYYPLPADVRRTTPSSQRASEHQGRHARVGAFVSLEGYSKPA